MFANRDFDPTEERFEQTLDGFGDDATRRCAKRRCSTTRTSGRSRRRTDADRRRAPVDPLAARSAPKRCASGCCGPRSSSSATSTASSRRLAAYRPLVHAGWVQPGLPEGDARAVRSQGARRAEPARHGSRAPEPLPAHHARLDVSSGRGRDAGVRARTTVSTRSCSRRATAQCDAQRAQRRAALLRPSGVRRARASDAACPRRTTRAAGRRPESRPRRERRGPARRWRELPRARARSTGSGSSCAPGGQPMTVTRVSM